MLMISNQSILGQTITNSTAPKPDAATLNDVYAQYPTTLTRPTATDYLGKTIIGTTLDPLYYNAPGNHIVYWTFNDKHGNIAIYSQNVTIQEHEHPVLSSKESASKTNNILVPDNHIHPADIIEPILLHIHH